MTFSTRIFLLLLAYCQATALYAQRGELAQARPSIFTTPTQGYPGFFDTNMAEPETMVIEWPPVILPFIPVPSIAMDYGLNERLTLGTNALMTAVPWLLGIQSAAVKARTLLYGSESMQSTATAYVGYLGGGKSLTLYWQMLTSNNAWKVSPSHVLSANAAFVNFGLEAGDLKSTDYASIQLSTAAISGGHQYIINDTMAISSYVMIPVWTSVNVDTISAALDLDTNARKGDAMWGMVRASFDMRSDLWVYSFGGLYNHGALKDMFSKSAGIAPWFSATRKY